MDAFLVFVKREKHWGLQIAIETFARKNRPMHHGDKFKANYSTYSKHL
jgi:hypothetical protein